MVRLLAPFNNLSKVVTGRKCLSKNQLSNRTKLRFGVEPNLMIKYGTPESIGDHAVRNTNNSSTFVNYVYLKRYRIRNLMAGPPDCLN